MWKVSEIFYTSTANVHSVINLKRITIKPVDETSNIEEILFSFNDEEKKLFVSFGFPVFFYIKKKNEPELSNSIQIFGLITLEQMQELKNTDVSTIEFDVNKFKYDIYNKSIIKDVMYGANIRVKVENVLYEFDHADNKMLLYKCVDKLIESYKELIVLNEKFKPNTYDNMLSNYTVFYTTSKAKQLFDLKRQMKRL